MYAEEILISGLVTAGFDLAFDLEPLTDAHGTLMSNLASQGVSSDAIELYDDMLLLDTAELSLIINLAAGTIPHGRVELSTDLMNTAAEKLLCGALNCPYRLRDTPTILDVVSFVGDGLKAFGQLSDITDSSWREIGAQPAYWAEIVDRIEGSYRDLQEIGRYASLVESGIVRLQGALWTAKATLVLMTSRVESSVQLQSAIEEYQESLGQGTQVVDSAGV